MAQLEHIIPIRQYLVLAAPETAGGLPERNDDELRVLRSVFDIVCNDGNVTEVERGVDLVHEVQWSGLI